MHEEWADIARAAREIGYPLVVKAVDLCAGMYVRRVDDEAQLAATVRAPADFPVNARGQRREPAVLLEAQLAEPDKQVKAAGSNNEYLGHVMAGDAEGLGARDHVAVLLGELRSGLVIR